MCLIQAMIYSTQTIVSLICILSIRKSVDNMKNKNLDTFISDLRSIHQDIKLISTDTIVVADWVRFKCRYSCRAYGKHLCCPPYAPTPEEMRWVVAEYKTAILARFKTLPGPVTDPKHTHHYLIGSRSKDVGFCRGNLLGDIVPWTDWE
jgi:hypothetical protein